MASWMTSVMSMGKTALERMAAPADPNQVRLVNKTKLASMPTMDEEGCMLLYGPKPAEMGGARNLKGGGNPVPSYEIVVPSSKYTWQSLSLFRTSDKDEATERFRVYQRCIPVLLQADQNLGTINQVQLFCDTCLLQSSNINYTPLHLAVELDLKSVLTNGQIETFVNARDDQGITPLMLAIKKENTNMTRYLLSKKADTNIQDNKKNTIYHFAANTNKEMIEIACAHLEDTRTSTRHSISGGDEPASAKLKLIVKLIMKLKILSEPNDEGNTPLHIACLNDKQDCVRALLCAGADVNIAGSADNVLPVHAASTSSSRSVKEIITTYAKQLSSKDIKDGGTPLHWAKSREVIEMLLEVDTNINAKNFKGDTALHTMVRQGRLDCALALITHGAEIDAKDNEGNTALHIAVCNAKVTIVRALLVFGADTKIENGSKQTAWMLALKQTQETGLMDSISIGVSLKENRRAVLYSLYAIGAHGCIGLPPLDVKGKEMDFTGIEKPALQKRSRSLFDDVLDNKLKCPKKNGRKDQRARVLCLDGGGVKGLVLTRILKSMEEIWGTPIMNCFDWVAGTSTGAMLALSLTTGKTVAECQNICFKLKDKIFQGSKPYDTKTLEHFLQGAFGMAKMYDIKHPKVVITATMADRSPPDLHLFRNYPSPQQIMGVSDYPHPELSQPQYPGSTTSRPEEQLVWKAARASGAAPSVFRPDGRYVDGGILANNPTLDVLTEIAEYNLALRSVDRVDEVVDPEVVLSLGTGVSTIRKTTVVDIFRPDNASDTAKLFLNWNGMGKLMLESIVETDNRITDRCRAWCSIAGIPYYRFSPYMATDIEMDEKDDKILIDFMWNTMAYVYSRKEDVIRLKKILLN